jgi:hypothetical protein
LYFHLLERITTLLQDPTLQRLKRMQIVTKNYSVLRGLQVVPLGLLFLALAAFELGWLHFSNQWILAAPIAMCGALLLYRIIGNHYDRLFGRVQGIQGNKLNRILRSVAVVVLLSEAIHIDSTMNLPISVTGLAFACMFFYRWRTTDTFRTHLFAMAFLMLWFSFLPLTAGFMPLNKSLIPGHGGYELVIGLLLTIGGLCDHWLLIRTFRETRQAYHD